MILYILGYCRSQLVDSCDLQLCIECIEIQKNILGIYLYRSAMNPFKIFLQKTRLDPIIDYKDYGTSTKHVEQCKMTTFGFIEFLYHYNDYPKAL